MQPTLTPQRERYLLLTLAGIQFSHILDFMIMMPLGPILIKAFGMGTHEFGLLVASYSFSAAFSGLLAATFIDRFERKRLMLTIFALFGLATLACGLAPGYITLLIARGMAGTFGGVMGAMVQTIVGDVIPFARRAKAGGIVSTAFSISTVAGVPLSLWLANHFQWRAPFILIAVLTVLFIVVAARILPELRYHISDKKRAHPFSAMFEVLRDPNHQRALMFSGLLIFSGFTVIPYITVYAVGNVGITQQQIPFIYLAGGMATLVTRTADRPLGGPERQDKDLSPDRHRRPGSVVRRDPHRRLAVVALAGLHHGILRAGLGAHDPGDGHHHLGSSTQAARHVHVAQCDSAVIRDGAGHNAGRIHHHAKQCGADRGLRIGGLYRDSRECAGDHVRRAHRDARSTCQCA